MSMRRGQPFTHYIMMSQDISTIALTCRRGTIPAICPATSAMETTEKILESYVRYVRRWATIPNVKCGGQHEIDLLAIDPVTHDKPGRGHRHRRQVEAGVWFRRGRLLMVSPDSRAQRALCQAETPHIVPCKFPESALTPSPSVWECGWERR
jgi:hypothetical protein